LGAEPLVSGTAVEAAARGYRTLLVERSDFAKETSSRSTKLVHGGVRYLEQMNVTLVLDALRERGHMLRNAPHLVHDLSFIIPAYSYFSLPYYGVGLKSLRAAFGQAVFRPFRGSLPREHSRKTARRDRRPPARWHSLSRRPVRRFARYAIALLRTLEDHRWNVAINYVEATGLIERGGKIVGIRAHDKRRRRCLRCPGQGSHQRMWCSHRGNTRALKAAAQIAAFARRKPGIAFRSPAFFPARKYRAHDS
jgi:glycerol-3-phosphate dehydrogenase